jgi:MFS family permease
MPAERMKPAELRAGASLAAIFGLRMLGLFLILPVFAVHAPSYRGGGDLLLVGIALGAYGLTQAILQIPFGIASDRWGRKPVIYVGLLIFASGSFLAMVATDIWTAIAGRALQGAGAISSVVVALAADLTSEGHRTKVMAMIGSMIGLAFALALVAAPALYRAIGMAGLFALVGVLSLAAIWLVAAVVPQAPPQPQAAPGSGGAGLALQPELLRLNLGIFALHAMQMAMFVVLPALLRDAGLPIADHWMFYLPVVLASFACMMPAIFFADRRNRPRPILLGAVALLAVVYALLALAPLGIATLAALMLGFFVAFNVLEALIPALVTRHAPPASRGAVIGVYNTMQTLGLFFGGLAGGWLAGRFGASGIFGACVLVSIAWLALALGMRAPPRIGTVNGGTGLALDGKQQT